MKVLAVHSARSIWLVKPLFLNPHGRFIVPAVAALAERYSFAKIPEAKDFIARPLDLKFEGGSFVGAEGSPIFVNLSIYDDGLIAETRSSTDESDRFLDDALSWFSSEYELPHYSNLEVEKLYANELIVQLELLPSMFSKKFLKFVNLLEQGVGKQMEFVSLHLGPDPETTKRHAPFRVERLLGTPFVKNRYYSVAPASTAKHLDLLEQMERAAGRPE